jgi:hypothetical protein
MGINILRHISEANQSDDAEIICFDPAIDPSWYDPKNARTRRRLEVLSYVEENLGSWERCHPYITLAIMCALLLAAAWLEGH